MVFTLVGYSYFYLKFLRSLQNLVEEIWLDKSGCETRVMYRNKAYRKFRGIETEEKYINTYLISPKSKPGELTGI